MSGGDAIDDGEARFAIGIEIGGAHRVAVHGGIIERRHIDRSDDVLDQHATQRLAQRHGFAFADRRDTLDDQTLGVGDWQQRAVESEAIVAELRHYASPRGISLAVADLVERHGFRLEHIGDAVEIVEHQHRHQSLR